jgi:hypothetical protein
MTTREKAKQINTHKRVQIKSAANFTGEAHMSLIEDMKRAKLAIEEWHHRIATEYQQLHPSPSIGEAILADYDCLIVECYECGRVGHASFHSMRRSPATLVADLTKLLRCLDCGHQGPPRARIIGLGRDPDPLYLEHVVRNPECE